VLEHPERALVGEPSGFSGGFNAHILRRALVVEQFEDLRPPLVVFRFRNDVEPASLHRDLARHECRDCNPGFHIRQEIGISHHFIYGDVTRSPITGVRICSAFLKSGRRGIFRAGSALSLRQGD